LNVLKQALAKLQQGRRCAESGRRERVKQTLAKLQKDVDALKAADGSQQRQITLLNTSVVGLTNTLAALTTGSGVTTASTGGRRIRRWPCSTPTATRWETCSASRTAFLGERDRE